MNNLHPSIKFTHEISSSTVDFLDIKISIISGTIQTSVYYKPTDSHSYLLYSSSHPKRCKDSIPYSQFLRLRRLCSDDADFREQCSILAEFFEHRGYSHDIVRKASNQVRDISRDHCLQSSRKSSTTERPTMVLSYHPNARLYTDIVKRNFISILHGDANTRRVFPDVPMTAYRRDRSLKDRLVHSRIFAPSTGCMQKCGRRRCGTCNHLHREADRSPSLKVSDLSSELHVSTATWSTPWFARSAPSRTSDRPEKDLGTDSCSTSGTSVMTTTNL